MEVDYVYATLQVGKQEKAMRGLRLAYKFNRLCRSGSTEYPVSCMLHDMEGERNVFVHGR